MKKQIFTAMLLAATVAGMHAETELTFSYASPDAELGVAGFKDPKAETYDVCIKLQNEGLAGQNAKVVGVQIPVVNDDKVNEYYVWVTSDKGTFYKPGQAVPVDGTGKSVTPVDGMIDVRFDRPIELTSEGLYVGYTFVVNELTTMSQKWPVVISQEPVPNGLFMRTRTSYYDWQDASGSYCSPMKVILRGDFQLDGAGLNPIRDVFAKVGDGVTAKVGLVNNGLTEISSIDYSYQLDGKTITGTQTFSPAVPNVIGSETVFNLDIPGIQTLGDHVITLNIDKVNGNPNNWENKTSSFHYVVVEELPFHRVVMEEWTGTWCQFCPLGFAGMDLIREYDPNAIVISYHYNDIMSMAYNNPYDIAWAYPCVYIDKTVACDPMCGTSTAVANYGYITNDWDERTAVQAPVAITLDSKWNEDKTELTIDSSTTFIYIPDDGYDYRLSYVVVEDGLTGETSDWWQSNYYGQFPDDYKKYEYLGNYALRGHPITDMEFDDVAVYSTPYLGIAGSLDGMKVGEPLKHSHKVKISKCINKSNNVIVQNKDNLRVVVMVVRSQGKSDCEVLNANMCKAGEKSQAPVVVGAVDSVLDDAQVVASEYYDLAGNRVGADSKGLQIVLNRYSDGTTKAVKRINR